MRDAILDNRLLFVIIALGFFLLAMGVYDSEEFYQAIGIAFIIAGAVGVHMMLSTRQVAKSLHERFNEQNDILNKNHVETTDILNKNHVETTDILRDIVASLKRIEKKL